MSAAAPALALVEPEASTQTRILLVEDQDPVRRAVARALRRCGFTVDEAPAGDRALALAAEHRPDIALVDLGLPQMSGFEVVDRLKSLHGACLPVLVLSGMKDEEARLRAFDAGADDFIGKPVYMPELVKRVDAFARAHRAYIETVEARERAEHLRLYAAEAAALLAHDLNNGLSTAMSNLGYLEYTGALTGESAEALAAASRAVERMAGLVRNFVDITRLEDGAMSPQLARVDVRRVLLDTIGIHYADAANAGAKITCRCEPGTFAMLDRSLFERVLHNIVGNAVRYVARGGVVALRVRIEGAPGAARENLVVEIGNTGPALAPTAADQLFEKYQTGRDARARRGMGLYFCRLACEAHGGSIALEASKDYDTNFVLRFPKHNAST